MMCASADASLRMKTATVTAKHAAEAYLGLSPILIGLQIIVVVVFIPLAMRGGADFRQLYTAGYMVRAGYSSRLYDYNVQKDLQNKLVSPAQIALPFNHLAYEALLFAPLSAFSYRHAYLIFLAVNVLLLTAFVQFLRSRLRNLSALWPWFSLPLVAGFIPAAGALMQGQDSIITLLVMASAMAAMERGREPLAGVLIALALFKFQIVLPIAALFLVWRRWKFVYGFVSMSAALVFTSICIVGPRQLMVYANSVILMANPGGEPKSAIVPTAMPNLRGLVVGVLGIGAPSSLILALTVLFSVAIMLWAALRAPDVDSMFPLAITVATLVSYHLLLYDASILLIPVAKTLDKALAGRERSSLSSACALLVLITPAYAIIDRGHAYAFAVPIIAFLWATWFKAGSKQNAWLRSDAEPA